VAVRALTLAAAAGAPQSRPERAVGADAPLSFPCARGDAGHRRS
jgi:hypothetical protein